MLGDAIPDHNDDKKILFVNLVQAIGGDLAAALDGYYGHSMVSVKNFSRKET